MARPKFYFRFSFFFIISLLGSNSLAVEEIVFSYAPDSIKFLSNDPVRSSYLAEIFSSMLGYTIRSEVEWNGLAEVAPWKRPECLAIIEMTGFSNKVDMPLEGNKFILENAGDMILQFELTAHRTNERYFGKRPVMLNMDLGNEIQESKIKQPTLLENIPEYAADRLQLALNDPELGELIKQSIFNISEASDVKLLTELATLKEFLKALSAQKSVVRDSVPDIYWLKITGLEPVLSVYGAESIQFKEALRLCRQIITEVEKIMRDIYQDNVVVAVIKSENVPLSLNHQGRRLLEDPTPTPTPTPKESNKSRFNLADSASEMYPVAFIMFVFVGLILVLSVLGISVALWHMDPGLDSMIYRMTNVRMKKD